MVDKLTPDEIKALSDDDLDALVAREVMGWKRYIASYSIRTPGSVPVPVWRNSKDEVMCWQSMYHPTHNATQAMAALRSYLAQHPSQTFACQLTAGWTGWVTIERADYTHFERPTTLERAICEALALAGEKEKGDEQRL